MAKRRAYLVKQRNKYLEDLGLEPYQYGVNWTLDDKRKDLRRWDRQRRKYGFDERETREMDVAYAEWLYSRLMMYRKRASKAVDLTYYSIEFDGKEYTQIEAIDKVLKWTRYYLVNRKDPDRSVKAFGKLQKASRLWTKLLPYVSW